MRDSLLWGPFLQDYEDFQRKILQGNEWLSPQDNILPFFPIPLLLFIHWRGVWKTLVQKLKQNVHSFFPITFKIHLPSHHTFEKLHINLKKKKSGSHCDNGLGASALLLTLFMQLFYRQDMSFLLVYYWNTKLSHFLWRTIQHHIVQQSGLEPKIWRHTTWFQILTFTTY